MTAKALQPPELHSAEAETAVLGSLLIDPQAWTMVSPILKPEDFYTTKHQWLYEAIGECARDSHADILVLGEVLERQGRLEEIGGTAALMTLVNDTPSAMQATQYAAIVRDYSMRRSLLGAATDVGRSVYDKETPATELQAQSEGRVLGCRRDINEHRYTIRQAASLAYDDMYYGAQAVSFGINQLDQVLGGAEPGVYIVAARPSMGKSAFLLQMLSGMAEKEMRTLLFTLEMSAAQVTQRMAASVARVSLQEIKQKKATPERMSLFSSAIGRIAEWPVTIIDKSEVRASDVLAESRRCMIEHGSLDAVFVDGLWLMSPARRQQSRLAEVGEISRAMKGVQRELGIPVFMAHQLSRACEARGDRRPILSDLRETGDVEQDADMVLMLFREGYYDQGHKNANVAECIIRKNRLGGPTGDCVKFFWAGPSMRFETLEKGTL